MSFSNLREKANFFLYENKSQVLLICRVSHVIISFTALIVLGFLYGFDHSADEKEFLLGIIEASFVFYSLYFFIRWIYEFNPREFIKKNWLESLVILTLVVEGISYNIFGVFLLEELAKSSSISGYTDISNVLIQLYFFFTILITSGKGGRLFSSVKVHPAMVFIFSFLLLIFIGTGLLMLPKMTHTFNGMGFVDALFTSTSATCVTGLMVEDAANFFTFRGQVIILILIKLGGLNIIAFGYFMAFAGRLGFKVKQHDVIEDFVNKETALNARAMLGKVVACSIGIEILGALMLFAVWGQDMFATLGDRIYHSIFLSVSAFNNAGISLFTDGLADMESGVGTNYLVHLVVTFVVFFGALGMVAIFDLFDPKNLRERLQKPWKTISFSTKIALYFSLILVGVGALAYFCLEYNNTLADLGPVEAIITSLFQSVTRTSGFNTVDIGSIGAPMLFLMIILMFIGSSSSSTGGGIKTSTFAVILADVTATIKGLKHTSLFKRTIPAALRSRAYGVLVIFIVGNAVGIFILSISEIEILNTHKDGMLALVFEQVSAMGTVGLSLGITPELTDVGKMVLAVSMFVGRVGTLTVAFALGRKLISKNFKYAEGHTMVG
ncbi:MAG: trk system potassium uptake protein TrkH [Saprospiraceae bacterium]|jgi:trk system potassium uptake protein TrkH